MRAEPTPIWAGAWELFRRNISLLLAISVIELLIEIAFGWSYDGFLTLISIVAFVTTTMISAYVVHISALTGQRFSARDLMRGTVVPNTAFTVVFVAVGVALALSLIGVERLFSQHGDLIAPLIALVAVFAIYFAFLCRFGTIFPAAAYDGDWSFTQAFARGRGTAWTLCKALLAGAVVGNLAMVFLAAKLESFDVSIYVWLENDTFSLVGMFTAFLIYLGYKFVTVLGVIAFCNAYRSSGMNSTEAR
ncbi:hypothetical protein [Roseovarius rhodophyticola]|uniref:Uncharacterized protein n=1 Tax=Roseovarius rhodophyticola TaxID=3080827 RepID=A0ABZ2TKP8_9RHOB|nr:hypothetical protein [Roseovarius sp. W115]MDV2928962.1 hypothetical protein [Roseovarius sp. W115]